MGFFFDNLRAYHLELEAEQGVRNGQPSLSVDLALEVLEECPLFVRGQQLGFEAGSQYNYQLTDYLFRFISLQEIAYWGQYSQQPFRIQTQTMIFQTARQTQALQDTKKCQDMNGILTWELWCSLDEGVLESNWGFHRYEEDPGLDWLWYIVSKPACY